MAVNSFLLMFYFNKSCVYAKLNILLLLSCIDLTTVGWNYITSTFYKYIIACIISNYSRRQWKSLRDLSQPGIKVCLGSGHRNKSPISTNIIQLGLAIRSDFMPACLFLSFFVHLLSIQSVRDLAIAESNITLKS